jgi:hypothetical protein
MLKPSDHDEERNRIECEVEELEVQTFKALADSRRLLDHVERLAYSLRSIATAW